MSAQNSSDPYRAQLYRHLKDGHQLERFTVQQQNGKTIIAISRTNNANLFIEKFRSQVNGHMVEIIDDQTNSFLIKGKSAQDLLEIVMS